MCGLCGILGDGTHWADGIGPEQLRIRELLARLEPESIVEVIVCTTPNIEGDATALYLNSDLAAHVTGVTIPVDSGHLLLPGSNPTGT